MQLDTNRNGLAAIFKDWQVPLIEELHNGKPMNSREAWRVLTDLDVRTQRETRTVSRASVINFLNRLVDQNLLTYTLETGKGGHRRIYKMNLTREAFAHDIMRRFADKLKEAFPDHSGLLL